MRKIIILIPFLLLVSCSDSSFDPTLLSDGFKGITQTGPESPEPLGGMYDPGDWCTGKSNGFNKELVDVPGFEGFNFGPCYPNPIPYGGETTLRFGIAPGMFVKIYLIDKHYNIRSVLVNDYLEAGIYEHRFNSTGLPKGIYRFIIETQHITCKGDLWIK